jgi:hypothetical protein
LAQILSHQASAPGGRELALSSKRNNFIRSAVPLTEIPEISAESHRQNSGAVHNRAHLRRIPNRALFCQAKALPVSRFRSSHHFAEPRFELLENLLIQCGFGSEVRMNEPAAQMTSVTVWKFVHIG